ncbi:hypothetical protein [Paludisphaera soli]|uniref:hypothetical protein n=1 Tax=Paludisphaera soli TaxID=2712865 RepID=UPI0013EB0EBB|nr:hypothetical protein [Paludisphaera soli]
MSTGMKMPTKKAAKSGGKSKKKAARKAAEAATRTEVQQPAREIEAAAPTHVVGKPAEVEPREYAACPAEEPEAAVQSAEAPDAGYGRCTESSDWENRGRS